MESIKIGGDDTRRLMNRLSSYAVNRPGHPAGCIIVITDGKLLCTEIGREPESDMEALVINRGY